MKRTLTQNASLHVYCRLLAEALNDAGYEIKKVMEVKTADVPWTEASVKELLWRPIQKAMTGEESSTEISTVQPSEIYEVLNRHIASNFGVHVPWPSEENQSGGKL